MLRPATPAALLPLLALLPAAAAFSSVPAGASPHDRITAEAAAAAGFPEPAAKALRRAVVAADYDEMEWDPETDHVTRVDARGPYRPEHHCDRVPPAGHLESFAAAVAHVRGRAEAAWNASRAGDAEAAVRALGQALHAAQDCSSHSNAVDLGLPPGGFPRAVLGQAPPPDGLWLTGFLPGADDPERPAGDPYPHADYAKDDEGKNAESRLRLPDNRTKYEAARALAVETSTLLLREWLAGLDAAQRERLAAVGEGGAPVPNVDVPAPPAALAALAAALAAARRRRR